MSKYNIRGYKGMTNSGVEEARGDQRAGEKQKRKEKDRRSPCRRFPERLRHRL